MSQRLQKLVTEGGKPDQVELELTQLPLGQVHPASEQIQLVSDAAPQHTVHGDNGTQQKRQQPQQPRPEKQYKQQQGEWWRWQRPQ